MSSRIPQSGARLKYEQFILESTAVQTAPLLPEIRLHLASEITPLWHATEAYLARHGIEPPFWAFAWVGGQALARYVLDHSDVVAGLNVLDIGCGGGICAIAAALAGAQRVCALDVDALACCACQMNAALNDVDDRVIVETADAIGYDLTPFDVILVGDVCYTRGESDDLARHLSTATVPVLFGDPGRQFLPRADIRQVATYSVETSRELEADAMTQANVWRLLGTS